MDLTLQGVSCLIANGQREGYSDEEIAMHICCIDMRRMGDSRNSMKNTKGSIRENESILIPFWTRRTRVSKSIII